MLAKKLRRPSISISKQHHPEYEVMSMLQKSERYQFTNAWFETSRSVWDQMLPIIKPTKALEIGSYEGAASCYLIDIISKNGGGELFCVDTWEGGIEHQAGGAAEASMSDVEKRYEKNIRTALLEAKNVKLDKIKAYSDIALSSLLAEGKLGYFDFIYVDGSHEAPDVLLDAVLSFKLLRVGGIIAFDDYLWSEPLPTGVDPIRCPKPAIDAFTNLYCRKLKVLTAPLYQLYVQKIAE